MSRKSYSVRIESELLEKLQYIAAYEGRSANSQINILVRECVKAFEKENGEIKAAPAAGSTQ